MTKLVGSTLIIEAEEDDVCDLCGTVAETRPYGPNGENVCFPCAMKNEEAATKQFQKILDKASTVVVNK